MSLTKVLRFDFSGEGPFGYDVVTTAIDGSNVFVGVSQGPPGVLKMPYPAVDSYVILQETFEDSEYVESSLTDTTQLYTTDRSTGNLWRVDKELGSATLLATTTMTGAFGPYQRPATGDLWLSDFFTDVEVYDSNGTLLDTYDVSPNWVGSGEWFEDRLYLTNIANTLEGFGYLEPDGSWTQVLTDLTNLENAEDLAIHGGRVYLSTRTSAVPGLYSCLLDGTDLRFEDDEANLAGLTVYGNTLWACAPNTQKLYSYALRGRWALGKAI